MDNNQTGIRNTSIGTFAGMSSVGNYNVFLGYYAGGNETGSNKLYIENSIADSDNALIYGEFDTNRLRVNGTLQIANPANTGYAFPLADGTAGQALRTDGNGQISFFTPIVGATKIDELIDGKTNSSSVFLGTNAGINISSGTSNVGVGVLSLNALTTGMRNTAMGYGSLRLSAYSTDNLAVGSQALWVNTTGSYNTASGSYALWSNTIGNHNTATGHQALFTFTGSNNTAVGDSALRGNAGSTGSNNTAVGYQALYQSTSGNYNVAIGHAALANNTTGSNNVAIGYDAHFTDPTLSNQVRIGNSAIWYAGVQVNWSITSDKRWKEQIRPLPFGLDMIEKLKPVDYIRKNNEFKTREIGFIAQDLKEVLDDLNYQDQGMLNIDSEGYMSVRYNDFIPVLVKAIQEQQQQLQEQQKQIDRLEALLEKAVGN